MKKLILLSIFLAGITYSQQFPVSVFKMYNAVPLDNPPSHSTQLTKTLPMLQSAYFNRGMAQIGDNSYRITNDQITELLDSASSHNVQLILSNLMEGYSSVERFYLDAVSDYFATVNGFPDPNNNDAEVPSVMYQKTSLRATVANDCMVKNCLYQPVHPDYPGLSYRAYFRLKASRPPGYDPNAPVVDIEVYNSTTHSSLGVTTIKNSNFTSDNVFQYIDWGQYFTSDGYAGPTPPSTPISSSVHMPLDISTPDGSLDSFDFRVKWYGGTTTIWLDIIRVEGAYFSGLDPILLFDLGSYNSQLKNTAKTFNSKPALARFYTKDEPYITQFLASKFTKDRLREAAQENGIDPSTGKGLGYAARHDAWFQYGGDDPFVRYTQEAIPYELATDIYRFGYGSLEPGNGGYTSYAQTALQTLIPKFRYAQANSRYTESGQWQYFPNIGQWGTTWREPYLSEVYSQVNLALAYGAKGVHYFHYWSLPSVSIIGLITGNSLDPITNSLHGENKWDGIKSLNQKLAGPFGTTLMNLTWQEAFSRYQLHAPLNQFNLLGGRNLVDVSAKDLETGIIDPENVRYVEVAHFKNNTTGTDYLMVVNRRTMDIERRILTLTFNNTVTWEITDVGSGSMSMLNPSSNFQTNLVSAGDGRLYKITGNIAPSAPKNLAWSGSVGQHPRISWSANTEPDLAGYKLYRKVIPDEQQFTLIATLNTSQTSYTDPAVTVRSGGTGGQWAQYYVKAYDLSSNISDPSNTISVPVNYMPQKIGHPESQPMVDSIPTEYSLAQNFPNPFNPSTTVQYRVPEDSYVTIKLFDVMGQESATLVNGFKPTGIYQINVDASKLASGIYFYKIQAGKFTSVKKMLLMK